MGSTTLMAAIAIDPIHLPTKMESTTTFKDITKMPMEAGSAFMSKLHGLRPEEIGFGLRHSHTKITRPVAA